MSFKKHLLYLSQKAASQFRNTKGAETLVAVETGHVLLSNGPLATEKLGDYGSKPCYPWAPGTLEKTGIAGCLFHQIWQ